MLSILHYLINMSSESVFLLNLYVADPVLRSAYDNRINKHNEEMRSDNYPNSGFDLLCPSDINISELAIEPNMVANLKVDLGIKCSAYIADASTLSPLRPSGYYMYARSSISSTCLRLANNVGIIDSGYRGNIKIALDIINNNCFQQKKIESSNIVNANDRIVQICSPDLGRIIVKLVEAENDLSNTSRGEGGFGSTGR